MPQTKRKARGSASGPREERGLAIVYETKVYGPPHQVTVRDSVGGWSDRPMEATAGDDGTVWTASVGSPDGTEVTLEFKLVLDGERWMAGANQSGTTSVPAPELRFDDSSVAWEG